MKKQVIRVPDLSIDIPDGWELAPLDERIKSSWKYRDKGMRGLISSVYGLCMDGKSTFVWKRTCNVGNFPKPISIYIRPINDCSGKVVEIDGIEYTLKRK